MRSMRARLNRLLGTSLAQTASEHDAFLSGFMKAAPRHRELVDELARRVGSRALLRLLPTTPPTAVPALPTDLRTASLDDLRAALAVALASWASTVRVPMPTDSLTTVTFTGEPSIIADAGRTRLLGVSRVIFRTIERRSGELVELDESDGEPASA
jgi:hypothetical protein